MQSDMIMQKRILVTDDDASMRRTIRLLLGIDQHTVTEAQDATEALDLLKREQFDLAITDFEMPGMDGQELARLIRQQYPSLPLLMITAHPGELCQGDDPPHLILDKPFSFADLRRAITALLSDTPHRLVGRQTVTEDQRARDPKPAC